MHVVRLDREHLLESVSGPIGFQCPNLHFAKSLTTELRLATQWLLGHQTIGSCRARMHFVLNQVGEFHDVNHARRHRLVEWLTRFAIVENHLAQHRQWLSGFHAHLYSQILYDLVIQVSHILTTILQPDTQTSDSRSAIYQGPSGQRARVILKGEQFIRLIPSFSQPLAQHRPPGIDVLGDQAVHIVALSRQPRHDIQPPSFLVIPQCIQRIILAFQPSPGTLGDLIPSAIDEPGSRQLSLNLGLVGTVKNRRYRPKTKSVNSPSQMSLQDLTDVHPSRHTQWVQYHVNRRAIGEERHILNRNHLGNNALVPVTACHLVTLFDLPQLSHADTDHLFHTHLEIPMLLTVEDFDIHDLAALTVGQAQTGILHLAGFLTENRAQQLFLGAEFFLTFGCDLTYQNVKRPHLSPDTDDPFLIQIFQGFIAHVGYVTGDLLWTQPGVTSLYLMLLDVDRRELILAHQSFADQDCILKISTLPRQESAQHVMPKCQLASFSRGAVRQHLAFVHSLTFTNNRPMVNTGALVRALVLVKLVSLQSFRLAHDDLITCHADHLAIILCQHNLPGIEGCPPLHPSSYNRGFGLNKGHRLTLHVGSH